MLEDNKMSRDEADVMKDIVKYNFIEKELSQPDENKKMMIDNLSAEIAQYKAEKAKLDKMLQEMEEKIYRQMRKLDKEIEQRKSALGVITDYDEQKRREQDSIKDNYRYPNMMLKLKKLDDLPLVSNINGVVVDLNDYKDKMVEGHHLMINGDGSISVLNRRQAVRFDGGAGELDVSKTKDGFELRSIGINIHSANVEPLSWPNVEPTKEAQQEFWKQIKNSETFVEATTGTKLPARQAKHKNGLEFSNNVFSQMFNKFVRNKGK